MCCEDCELNGLCSDDGEDCPYTVNDEEDFELWGW